MRAGRWIGILAVGTLALARGSSALAPPDVALSLSVPKHPIAVDPLRVTFRPSRSLPKGGYYYAALVLDARSARRAVAAECAVESGVSKHFEARAQAGQRAVVTLDSEGAVDLGIQDWCAGATYIGAVYAVPHGHPCPRGEECFGHVQAPECYPGEFAISCSEGLILPPLYLNEPPVYRRPPGQLPRPRDRSTRIVARFQVRFNEVKLVRVAVPREPGTQGEVRISIRARHPVGNGGYYYAAAVITRKSAFRLGKGVRSVPGCAAASDMSHTYYGYPGTRHALALELAPQTPEPSGAPLSWCAHATYLVGIYAVPHPPRCGEYVGACGERAPGPRIPGEVEGVVPNRIQQPGMLPAPQDSLARIVARFKLLFGS